MGLGWVVALVYKRTRGGADFTSTFPPTLVLLAILIAMVTPVIGGNLARAFGLVGARVVYDPPSENWRLSVFGTNLSNEKYLNSGMVSGAFSVDAATVGRPREVGASLQIYFD